MLQKKPAFSLLELPLISKYRVVCFTGETDGTLMTQQFQIQDFLKKSMVLKSIKLIPYASDDAIEDFYITDGVDTWNEVITNRGRLTRVIDSFTNSANIDIRINGVPIGIFPQPVGVSAVYPMDLFVDNIYYHYPENIETFTISIDGLIVNDIVAHTGVVCNMVVMVECYIL